jgi:hypothetical protein
MSPAEENRQNYQYRLYKFESDNWEKLIQENKHHEPMKNSNRYVGIRTADQSHLFDF